MKTNLKHLVTLAYALVATTFIYAFTPYNTGMELQLGIASIGSYSRPLFANAIYNEPRGWQNSQNKTITDTTLFDADGYPLKLTTAVPKMVVQPGQGGQDNRHIYSGKVCITWEGNADIRVVGTKATFIAEGSSAATGLVNNGVRYYNNGYLDNGNPPEGLRIEILAIDESNPPKKIRAWMNDKRDASNTKTLRPEDQGGVTHLIHPTFAERFLNDPDFSVLRTMDLLETPESKIVNWSDRRKPSHCFQSGSIGTIHRVGVAYEYLIQMCNQFKKDLWLNSPTFANEDYMTKLAQLFQGKDPDGIGSPGLDTDLRCFLEHSNELGWTFFANECNAGGAAQSPAISGRQYAARLKAKAASVFRAALDADKKDQYKIIHSIQTADFGSSDQELQQVMPDNSYGGMLTPNGKPDFIGVTTYCGSKIEQEVFDNYNYMDLSQRESELSRAFVELEKRMLVGAESTTGVDFTGGGISSAAKMLRVKYHLPLMVYEGGAGLNLASSKYVSRETCKIVPKTGNSAPPNCYPFNLFLNSYADSCHTNGKKNYTNFIRDMHKHPDMAKILEINLIKAKMDSVEMMTQFGEVFEPNGNIDYGYWGCMASLSQPLNEAYRYQFLKNWYAEHKDIRELGHAINSAPQFATQAIAPVFKDMPFRREILITGGDGAIQAKMINRPVILPEGLNFSFDAQNKKIIISGTIDEIGSHNFLYQILDEDKDPAYKIFSISCINNPQDSLYAYDDFGTPTVDSTKLDSLNTGRGFSSFWRVANASYSASVATNFVQRSTNQLIYPVPHTLPTLKCSEGGKAQSVPSTNTTALLAQRTLDASKFDFMADANDPLAIGKAGTSLWCSFLYHRPNVNNSTTSAPADIVRFVSNNGGFSYRKNSEVILVAGTDGKYRLDCHPLSQVKIDPAVFTSVSTNITATDPNHTQFLVFEFKFGTTTDTVRFYHNPTAFGVEKPNVTPAATYVTPENERLSIAKFTFVGNKTASKSYESIDDLRFGDSYRAVSPIDPLADNAIPSTPANFSCTELIDGNVTLSWDASTDDVAVIGYHVYYNGNKIATVDGLTKSISSLLSGSHQFYVRAVDQAGKLSEPTNTINRGDTSTISLYPSVDGIQLFPNPIKDKLFVKLNNNFESIDISVINSTGILLLKKTGVANNQYIDLSSLSKGLYFVLVGSGDQQKSYKVIKN